MRALSATNNFCNYALNYRGSSLAQGEASLALTAPGTGLGTPRYAITRGKGFACSIFFRGPHFTLLEFSANAAAR